MGVEGQEDKKATGVEGSGVMGVAGSEVSAIIISCTISSAAAAVVVAPVVGGVALCSSPTLA
jgi:hypothetical protein